MQTVQMMGTINSFTSDMKNVVGRPMDDISLPKPNCYGVSGKAIEWTDFNYPPLLQVVHYDPNELPERAASISRCLCLVYHLIIMLCLVNLVDTIVLVALVGAPWTWIVQSLLHVLLLPSFAFVVFYAGYRGLAEQDAVLLGRFTLGKILLGALCFLMGLLPVGCINGLFAFTHFSKYNVGGGPAIFWTLVIFAESFMWFALAALCALNLWRIRTYDRAADVATTSKV